MKFRFNKISVLLVYFVLLVPFAQAGVQKSKTVSESEALDTLSNQEIVQKIKHNQQWQAQKNKCPAEISPNKAVKFSRKEEKTDLLAARTLNPYYQRCVQDGKGYACYNLALGLQSLKFEHEAEVVFQEACRLGVASGCTNRAAGMLAERPRNKRVKRCGTASFAKACDWKDPWGCTMYAGQLVAGDGVSKDTTKALAVMKNSCLHGKSDPACQAAQRIKDYIKAEKQSDKDAQRSKHQ